MCARTFPALLRGLLVVVSSVLLFLFFALAYPLGVAAATVTVNTTGDTNNACATSGAGTCSLRDAVTFANNNSSTTIDFSLPNASTITLTGGTLTLAQTAGSGTTITGPGAAALTVDGHCTLNSGVCASGGAAVLIVTLNVTATISGMTIQHGNSAGAGGGIENFGTLSVTNSSLSGNRAISGGGGIATQGSLTVTGSTFSGNSVQSGAGGGIAVSGGTATITNSTFSGNTALSGGGIANQSATLIVTDSTFSSNNATQGAGIENDNAGTLNVTNSTLSGNAAIGIGGGMYNSGTLNVTNCTLSGNSATGGLGGGGIGVSGGTLNLTNTIVSGNTGGDLDSTPPTINSHSLVGGTPLLGTLGGYGGSTQTIPLLPGSPAISAGTTGAGIPTTDQRGIARTGHNDIGAIQSQGFTQTISGGNNQSMLVSSAFSAPLEVTVSSSHSEPVDGGQVMFTANPGGSGQSATFGVNPATITSGKASVTATANGSAGIYTVTASALGAVAVSFNLTNAPVAPVVNSTGDGAANVANCTPGNVNICRLRDAIAAISAGAASGAITFDSTAFPANTARTIMLNQAAGTLVLSRSMAIDGAGHSVTVDGGCSLSNGQCVSGGVAIFKVASGITATLNALTIAHGSDASGGGIIISGGGITVNGTLILTNSAVTGNSTSNDNGGGLLNLGTLTMTNSSLVGNIASQAGGGLANGGTATLTNCTLSGNAALSGGGIFSNGTLTLTNTIVAASTSGGDVVKMAGTLTGSYTLIDDAAAGTGLSDGVNGNIIGQPARLGTPGNFAGDTQVIPLLPGSPAIGTGDDTTCSGAAVGGKDQRGVTRPQGAHCDIGAFEARYTVAISGGNNQSGVISAPFVNPLQVTIGGPDTVGDLSGAQVTFSAPGSGPSAFFPLSTIATTNTNGQGSVPINANLTTGGPYHVTASLPDAGEVSFTLTNTLATPVVNRTGDGAAVISNCAVGNASTCRLRDALAIASIQAMNGDVTVTFALPAPSTITLDSAQGPLVVYSTMIGPGVAALTITGNNATSVIVTPSGELSISGVTIAGGKSTGGANGGGITNQALLTITNTTFSGNNAPSVAGGAILNTGSLTLTGCIFSNNTAVGNGGAIENVPGGTVTVTNSTFSGNRANQGGAIFNDHDSTLTITNSTITGNAVNNICAGLYNFGTMTVTNSTFTGNTADATGGGGGIATIGTLTVTNTTLTGNYGGQAGGGIFKIAGALSVTNSIIAGNTAASAPDLQGSASGGHNLIGGSPLLGTLGNNGGLTQTVPLLAGSPAIGTGDPAVCAAAPVGGKDQREKLRRADRCSIGAYEAEPAIPNVLPSPAPPGGAPGSPNPLPGARPPGQVSGSTPHPLPPARP